MAIIRQAGLRVPSLRVADLADALTKATTNQWVHRVFTVFTLLMILLP